MGSLALPAHLNQGWNWGFDQQPAHYDNSHPLSAAPGAGSTPAGAENQTKPS